MTLGVEKTRNAKCKGTLTLLMITSSLHTGPVLKGEKGVWRMAALRKPQAHFINP